jgi:TolA-binding protein
MKIRAFPFLLVLVVVLATVLPVSVSADRAALNRGLEAFRRSEFQSAMDEFRAALVDATDLDTEATAYFWLAKAAMAEGRLNEADKNLAYYLQNFGDHRFAPEARYQQGRLLYMQDDFESAIQLLERFTAQFPDSPFVANAIYWSGEALFNLGRLDEARRVFQTVLRDYPASFRVEAARYRVAVIELTFREQELLQLLRWSHEEYLRALDEFERREGAYQEALVSYQQRLQNAADEDFRDEIVRLNTEVRILQETIRSRDAQIRRLEEQLTTLQSATTDDRR